MTRRLAALLAALALAAAIAAALSPAIYHDMRPQPSNVAIH
jgi:hypothetical protein